MYFYLWLQLLKYELNVFGVLFCDTIRLITTKMGNPVNLPPKILCFTQVIRLIRIRTSSSTLKVVLLHEVNLIQKSCFVSISECNKYVDIKVICGPSISILVY